MLNIKRLPLLLCNVLGYLTIMLIFSGTVTPAYGQTAQAEIPSLGKGHYEIVMFTDYFCPPCRRIDAKAEPLLKELLATGKVKLTFVDVPFSRATPIYAKHYLYALNVNADVTNVFHVRKILFDAAQDKRIQDEKALVAYLKNQKVEWKALNEKNVFPLLSFVIKHHDINATPTCVIRYPSGDIKNISAMKIYGRV